jgi:hypothetical protein
MKIALILSTGRQKFLHYFEGDVEFFVVFKTVFIYSTINRESVSDVRPQTALLQSTFQV